MRRQSVPAVEVAPFSARLEAVLRSRVAVANRVPLYERKLQPLVGIRWPRASTRIALPGEVALFDVEDAGELQEW